jgi:hypothetical protein
MISPVLLVLLAPLLCIRPAVMPVSVMRLAYDWTLTVLDRILSLIAES